eukprot:1013632-Pleurochrysis_carterae.AAC.1
MPSERMPARGSLSHAPSMDRSAVARGPAAAAAVAPVLREQEERAALRAALPLQVAREGHDASA